MVYGCVPLCNFEKFKTLQTTINQEMHEQVRAVFCLLYSQQSYIGIKYLQHFISCSYSSFNFLVDFPFCRPTLPNFQPGLCCFQSILVFKFCLVLKLGACGYFNINFRFAIKNLKGTL